MVTHIVDFEVSDDLRLGVKAALEVGGRGLKAGKDHFVGLVLKDESVSQDHLRHWRRYSPLIKLVLNVVAT